MKKILMLLPLVALLTLASAMPTVLAASKTEKVGYSASGQIQGAGSWGTMTLTLSGNLPTKTPDYEYDGYMNSWEWIWQWEMTGEEEYSVGEESWKMVTTVERETMRQVSGNSHVKGWYSPQSKLSGKIEAAWEDGPATAFTVQLDPYNVQKVTNVGTMTVEVTETTIYEHYRLEEIWDGFWWWQLQYSERGEPVSLGAVTYDLVQTTLLFELSGKIQSKGRSPLQGTFMLWDTYTVLDDGSGERSVSGWGQFGPYNLNVW